MSTWYKMAKQRMRERHISQEQMAERLGVTQGAIGHWLNGRRQPKLDVINRLLRELDLPALSVTIAPDENTDTRENATQGAEQTASIELVPGRPIADLFRRVPIKGTAQLGPEGYWDTLETADGWIDIPTTDPDAYSLRVKGDSMSPAIRSGWAIWCEPNHPLVPGEYVMVRRTNGETMVKELLFETAEAVNLMSVNGDYGRISIPREEIAHIHYVGGIVQASKIRHH